MTRLILTFPTLTRVLAADKTLRDRVNCRPTPTPPGLSSDICSISIELIERQQQQLAMSILEESGNEPSGVHEVS